MAAISFYDFDYMIEINEKRLEQYTSAYQKVLEKLTHIILIYSAITIFLIPIIQNIFFTELKSLLLHICFIVFAILFIISIIFTVRLIIPVHVAYLEPPQKYYDEFRRKYEQLTANHIAREDLLKASYIDELERAIELNSKAFKRKNSFYYNALLFGLLSAVPYVVCLGFHISKKDDQHQKIEIASHEKYSNLHTK